MQATIPIRRWVGLAILACGPLVALADSAVPEFGPAWHRYRLTIEAGERTEGIGPFWRRQVEWAAPPGSPDRDGLWPWLDDGAPPPPTELQKAVTTLAISPLFSLRQTPALDATSWDLLYPLITYDRYGAEYRFQVLQLLSLSGGKSQAGTEADAFSLFPFYFQRRSSDPEQDYTALWPFYGHVEQRFFRDEVNWVMWPLYVQTRKKDVVTDNYLAPFVHQRHGDGLRGWQVWPLIGTEHKDVTTRTNQFGDPELVPGHDAFFALWPLFFHNNAGVGTTNLAHQLVFLPFYSFQLSPQKDSRTYLWPLGPTFVEDRVEKYRQVGVPWPLIVFARGEGKYTDRVWPLYGRNRYHDGDTTWALWPVYWHRDVETPTLDRDLTRIAFFLYTDITDHQKATGKETRRTDLWPLFTARRDAQGNERFQLLALLEPILGANPSIERNWSPVWSIWRSQRNPQTGAASQSFLWNLYRHDARNGRTRTSFLFGLIRRDAGPDGTSWRWFHLIGSRRPATAPDRSKAAP